MNKHHLGMHSAQDDQMFYLSVIFYYLFFEPMVLVFCIFLINPTPPITGVGNILFLFVPL